LIRAFASVLALWCLAAPAAARELALEGSFLQGGLVIGHAAPGARVIFEGRAMRVSDSGEFLIGFGRDAGASATLVVVWPGGESETRMLGVTARQWDIQRIDGLPDRQVTPPPEEIARIKAEAALIAAVRARDTSVPLFRTGFVWPASGPVSGVYGSQRILNGEPRQPHFGLDIAAPPGAPVVAAADAIVALAHDGMFFTGKTLVLDHGFGLTSAYSHLSKIAVRVGERVKQGQKVGEVGATGRVTGAHLDWRVNLFDIRLDPALLLPPRPEN
jgi:murein DD-endopeptidase MepM/ murein hydrolase activator NlpD